MGFLDRFRRRRDSAPTTSNLDGPGGSPLSDRSLRREPYPPSETPRGVEGPGATFAYAHPRFAVVDVETTGLSASSHRILEIAVVTTDPLGQVLDTWTTRLNPQGPVGATHIHGITDRDVAHAPLFSDVIDDLNARLVGAALAGHNARFDLAFLRAEYARAGWRMPFVPALCTLEASNHHLPHLPRRRLVDVCAAVGLPPHRAHSALHDATATAGLLAAFLHPDRPPRQIDIELPGQGHAVVWPSRSEGGPLPIGPTGSSGRPRLSEQARRNMVAAATAPPAKPLVQLISRFSLLDAQEEGAPRDAVAYMEKLAEVLEDGVLDPAEATALAEVAVAFDLATTDVAAAHLAFVRALAREAMADGKLTRAERAELGNVARALDIPASAVSAVLKEATRYHHAQRSKNLNPLPADWPYGEPLRVGDRIVFTGCDPSVRRQLEEASEAAGIRVMNGVASTTALLVTDGSMTGTKARRASELGTRVVDPDTYRVLLSHLQPAAGLVRTPVKAEVEHEKPAEVGITTDRPSTGALPSPTPHGSHAAGDEPSPAALRAWGRQNGWALGARGRLPKELREAYLAARPTEPGSVTGDATSHDA